MGSKELDIPPRIQPGFIAGMLEEAIKRYGGGVQLKKIRISNFRGAFVFFRIFYQNFFTLEITKYPREMDL